MTTVQMARRETQRVADLPATDPLRELEEIASASLPERRTGPLIKEAIVPEQDSSADLPAITQGAIAAVLRQAEVTIEEIDKTVAAHKAEFNETVEDAERAKRLIRESANAVVARLERSARGFMAVKKAYASAAELSEIGPQ